MSRLMEIALAFVIAALPARAADPRVAIVEHGLYTADIKSQKTAPDGIVDSIIENLCHYATTTAVPLKRDLHFGFRIRVDGLAPGAAVDLTKIVRFPTVGIPPGGRPLSGFTRPIHAEAGKLYYIGYGLDYDWELMPGRWNFRIDRLDRTLAEMDFIAVEGAEMPAPSARGSTCFKLSSL